MSSIQSQNNSLIHREDGLLEVRVRVGEWELRHTGRQTEAFTIRGYAAVYNQLSLDLGGFREQIADGAFDEILASDPDVHFLWDHDTKYVAARTKNDTLKLWSDNTGLGMEAQVGNYSWAKDLRIALERGDIDQGSFAFAVADGGDDWEVQEDETVLRTIRSVGGLYDVTVTAQGAYPQTSMAAVRSLMKAHGMVDGVLAKETDPVAGEGGDSSQPGEVEEPQFDQDFEMWREAMRKRAKAQREIFDKLKEKMEKLQ
ncbi:MAG TPA: HK97 family phage prohead protease [Chloroflexota bacterium]|jgi:hypothetical protein